MCLTRRHSCPTKMQISLLRKHICLTKSGVCLPRRHEETLVPFGAPASGWSLLISLEYRNGFKASGDKSLLRFLELPSTLKTSALSFHSPTHR